MNGVMTREEVGREVDERLRMVNSRLTSLEALKPKAAMIAKSVDGHHHMETVELFDEGTSQGFGYQMDFVGTGVTGTRSGRKFTVNITGLGSSINLNEDTVLVGAASTINFTEPDATLLSLAGTTVTVNTALYTILAGRVGGQTITGGTVDNTYLTLRGNSIDATDPVILASPLRMAASANNYIQDSAGNRHLTFASDAASIAVTSTFAGSLGVRRFLGVGGGVSASIRMVVQTWGNLGAATNQMIQVNLSGTQTLVATARFGFQFAGTYDMAGFNLTTWVGVSSSPTIHDTTFTGTLTTYACFYAQIATLSGLGQPAAITQTAGLYVDTPITLAGSPIITDQAGVLVRNQGQVETLNAYGIDVQAQSGAGGNSIGVRIGLGATYSLQLSDTGGTAAGGITWGTDTNLYRSAANRLKTDDALMVVGNVGFNNQTPAAMQTYAASNVTTDRTYDANATSIDELADVVGTLIADLRAVGLVA